MDHKSRPSAEDQKQLVEEEMNKEKLKAGDTWYLISTRWYNLWKEHVHLDEDDSSKSTQAPDRIDNSDIIASQDETTGFIKLKPNLTEEFDFVTFSEAIWKLLLKWYGGGPEIVRQTIEIGEGTAKKVVVEVYPLAIKVQKMKESGGPDERSEIEISISRKSTVKQFKTLVCKRFQIEEEKSRVWNFFDPSTAKVLEEDSTLEDCTIVNEQKILIESQLADGTWPKDNQAAGTAPETEATVPSTDPTPSQTKTAEPEKRENGSPKPEKKKKRSILSFLGFGGNSNTSSSSSSTSSSTQVSSTINGHFGGGSKPGVCGLGNLGNTCFMNSALQCLSNTVPLTEYFLNGKYKADINRTNPLGMKGKIAEEFGALLKQLWSPSNANSAVAPRNFKLVIGKYAPQFSGYNQNDSQELLAFLLDGLHEDLNRVLKKVPTETKDMPDKTDEEVAKVFWENHLKRDQSIIVDLFQGQLKSKLVCPKCNHVSITFDPYMYLSLPLPTEKETILEVIVIKYTDPWQLPIKYAIKMDKNAKMEDLREAVGKVCNIPAARIVLADLYKNYLYTFLVDGKGISGIRSSDVTIAYEVAPDAAEEHTKVQVLHRKEKKKEGFSFTSVELFGIPAIIWVQLKKASRTEIYRIIWNRMKSFVKKSESGEEPDVDDDPESDKFPFKLAYVTHTGTSCSKCSSAACNGCLMTPSDKPAKFKTSAPALAIDWDPKVFKKYFDRDAAVSLKVHPSVEEAKKNSSKALTLSDCLNLFTTDERLSANDTWYCPKCKEFHRAMKKFDLWSVPQILVVHLKRFLYTKWSREKLSSLVDFPLEGLDLSPFVLNKQDKAPIYDLFAVSNHSGGLGGGHYTAYAKNKFDNRWYLFNDSQCSLVSSTNDIQSSAAYVLFYKRRE